MARELTTTTKPWCMAKHGRGLIVPYSQHLGNSPYGFGQATIGSDGYRFLPANFLRCPWNVGPKPRTLNLNWSALTWRIHDFIKKTSACAIFGSIEGCLTRFEGLREAGKGPTQQKAYWLPVRFEQPGTARPGAPWAAQTQGQWRVEDLLKAEI